MMLIQLQLSTVNQNSSRRHKQTIQISSASPPPPPYPTPPPSAPSSPTSDTPPPPPPPCPPRKVRVPLLSPGGLYQAAPPAKTSSQAQTIERSLRSGPAPEVRGAAPPPSHLPASGEPPAKKPKLDTKALAEASKNLTQTLKQLSSEVLTTRPESDSHQPKKEVKVCLIDRRLHRLIFTLCCRSRLTAPVPPPPPPPRPLPALAAQEVAAAVAAAAGAAVAAPVVAVGPADTAGNDTVAGGPSLSPCTTTGRGCTRAHSQVVTRLD